MLVTDKPKKPARPADTLPLAGVFAPAAAPAGTPHSPAPRVVEFRRMEDGKAWRIERMETAAAEFAGLNPGNLDQWQHAQERNERGWYILRRLYGVQPVIVPIDADPDDYGTLDSEGLCAALGIERRQLQAELEECRRRWDRRRHGDAAPATAEHAETAVAASPTPEQKAPSAPAPTLVLDDTALLEKHGFPSDNLFAKDQRDRSRFAARVREWEPLFADRMTATVARSALMTELRIWRVERAVASEDPAATSKDDRQRYRQLADELDSLNNQYREMLARIDDQAPWFNVTGQNLTLRGAISDLVEGLAEYYRDGSTQLIDGVFTATEIQVLLRVSRQSLEPQYRAGFVTYLNAMRANIFGPAGRDRFRQNDLAKLDAGFKGAVKAYAEQSGEHIPDLESEGPASEYDDLHAPALPEAPARKLFVRNTEVAQT